MRRYILWVTVLLIFGLGINGYTCFAAQWMRSADAELTLENEPKVGELAIINLSATVQRNDVYLTLISGKFLYR